MNDHLKGIIITSLGVLFVVPDSLFVRLIQADPMVVAFYRGLISGGLVALGVLIWMGPGSFRNVLRAGWPGVIYMLLIGSTAPGFVLAVTQTSVANVVFIFATIPVFAAILSRMVLHEPISKRMVLTIAAVIPGLAIIAYGSGETEIASWKGDVWALYVSAAYAGALTAIRKVKEVSMIPAIPVASIGAALVLLPFISPVEPFEMEWRLFMGHGAFIAVATCFLTLGPRYISSAEVSLLILLESVLAPILVWFVIGEDPGPWALLGGAVVIGALVISNIVVLRRKA